MGVETESCKVEVSKGKRRKSKVESLTSKVERRKARHTTDRTAKRTKARGARHAYADVSYCTPSAYKRPTPFRDPTRKEASEKEKE